MFLILQKTNFKFSFGVVLWELLTCRVPWRGSGYKFPQQILKAVAHGERPQATPEELEQAPHGFLKLMERCWDGKASKRPTFNKCLRQLRRIASASINQPKLQRGSSPGQTGGKVQVAKLRKQLAKLSTDVTALAEKKRFREAAAVQEKYEAVEKLLATALALTCENCGKSEGLAGGSMFCMLCGHTRSEVSVQEAAKRKQEAAEKKGAEARKRRQERRKRALEAARQAREEKQAAMKLAQEKKGMGTIAEDSEEEEDEDEEEEEVAATAPPRPPPPPARAVVPFCFSSASSCTLARSAASCRSRSAATTLAMATNTDVTSGTSDPVKPSALCRSLSEKLGSRSKFLPK